MNRIKDLNEWFSGNVIKEMGNYEFITAWRDGILVSEAVAVLPQGSATHASVNFTLSYSGVGQCTSKEKAYLKLAPLFLRYKVDLIKALHTTNAAYEPNIKYNVIISENPSRADFNVTMMAWID